MFETNILRVVVFITVVFYFVFKYFDKKHIRDEREDLIHLKSLEFVQRISSWVTAAVAIVYIIYPEIDAIYPIIALFVCWVYSYPIGKLILRKQM